MRLWRLAALDGAEEIAATFSARLDRSTETAFRSLANQSLLHPRAELPSPEMPESFTEMLAAALALDAVDPPPTARDGLLDRHYLDIMPTLRVEQLCSAAQPSATLFHTPLDWSRLPRVTSAIDRLFAIVASACGDTRVLAAPTADAFRAARPTLSALYRGACYGGFMPLLYAYPADLAAMGRALDAGLSNDAVIDRLLSSSLAHELSHLGRKRRALFPLYLDECVTAHLGALVCPETLWPAANEPHALLGAPWLAQVGQVIARTVGEANLVRAHAGVVSWSEVLPRGLEDVLLRLGWTEYVTTRAPHFLSSSLIPEPWMKLFFLAAAGAPVENLTLPALSKLPWREVPAGEESPMDGAIVEHALRAMCVRNFQIDGAFRVARRAPAGSITVDIDDCSVTVAAGEDGLDARAPTHLFPPAIAARLRARGIARYEIALDDVEAIPIIAAAIVDGAATHRGRGYALTRSSA